MRRCEIGSKGSLFSPAGLLVVTWIAQLVVQWFEYVDEAQAQQHAVVFWSTAFWVTFGQATFENWQSEFPQLGSFVIAGAYLVYKGSSESGDGDERIEAKLDALLRQHGVAPEVVESTLPAQVRRTAW